MIDNVPKGMVVDQPASILNIVQETNEILLKTNLMLDRLKDFLYVCRDTPEKAASENINPCCFSEDVEKMKTTSLKNLVCLEDIFRILGVDPS